MQANSAKPKSIARSYPDEISYYEGYISVLFAMAGKRVSKIFISILAHSALYGTLDPAIKKLIVTRNDTTLQVVSNSITKLRKAKYLDGLHTIPKLCPPKGGTAFNLVFNVA